MPDLPPYLFAHHKRAASAESRVTKSSAKWKSHHPSASQKPLALLGALEIWSTAEQLSGYPAGGPEPGTPLCPVLSRSHPHQPCGPPLFARSPRFFCPGERSSQPIPYFKRRAPPSKYPALTTAIWPHLLCANRAILVSRGELQKSFIPSKQGRRDKGGRHSLWKAVSYK